MDMTRLNNNISFSTSTKMTSPRKVLTQEQLQRASTAPAYTLQILLVAALITTTNGAARAVSRASLKHSTSLNKARVLPLRKQVKCKNSKKKHLKQRSLLSCAIHYSTQSRASASQTQVSLFLNGLLRESITAQRLQRARQGSPGQGRTL